jgi:hypothetical protein
MSLRELAERALHEPINTTEYKIRLAGLIEAIDKVSNWNLWKMVNYDLSSRR